MYLCIELVGHCIVILYYTIRCRLFIKYSFTLLHLFVLFMNEVRDIFRESNSLKKLFHFPDSFYDFLKEINV